jgi:7-cyano-7-deazaguanine synthase
MRSIVLLSGGLDSAVNLKKALLETEVAQALTFDYGQRAALQEAASALAMTARLGVRHETIHLPWLRSITKTALVDESKAVPKPRAQDLDDVRGTAAETARQVWVPNRNGVFVNIAAAYAEGLDCGLIVTGFNAEEGATFPDNSPEFIEAVNEAFGYSTLKRVRTVSYTSAMNKAEIVRLGRDLGAPLDLIWCCYHGGPAMCGECESCLRAIRAFKAAGCAELMPKFARVGHR